MSTTMQLKYDPETVPGRMRNLPVSDNGWLVPWFVEWIDGKPDFRVMNVRRWIRAVKEKLCWVCGKPLGVYMTFIAGPMCGVNRTSAEPPSHLDCAMWSVRNCPFLSRPHMVRRENDLPEERTDAMGGFGLKRNPGVMLIWVTKSYGLFNDGMGGRLIKMGPPENLEFWFEGRQATRAEIDESIRTGLPALEEVARQQAGGIEELECLRQRFEKLLPEK